MKKIVIALLSVAAVLGGVEAASLQGGGGIPGVWATGSQCGQVEIYRCGTVLRARIIDAAPLRANCDQRDVKNPDRALCDRLRSEEHTSELMSLMRTSSTADSSTQ